MQSTEIQKKIGSEEQKRLVKKNPLIKHCSHTDSTTKDPVTHENQRSSIQALSWPVSFILGKKIPGINSASVVKSCIQIITKLRDTYY